MFWVALAIPLRHQSAARRCLALVFQALNDRRKIHAAFSSRIKLRI
jgi:hypothetical protein